MIDFKQFISEEKDFTTEWMSGSELSKHIPKTAVKHIRDSKEHNILTNHDIANGGTGQLMYRIHTKHYGNSYKTQTVQAASTKEDKDGFTHHVSYDIIRHSAKAHSHLKTSLEKKQTLPWHQKVE